MARYRLHCIGASGNSYKLALYMNCAGLDGEPPYDMMPVGSDLRTQVRGPV